MGKRRVKRLYYPETELLVKEAAGAGRVLVFDLMHASSLPSLNNLGAKGMAAASVIRVHCDYAEVRL